MSNTKHRHVPHNAEHDPSDEHGYAGEAAREESQQRAMAAREKSSRMKMNNAQASTMRLRRGNQPRGR
jgi:hypothetical protein